MIAKTSPENTGSAPSVPNRANRVSIVECCRCGYDPEEQIVVTRSRCPKCHGFSWRRIPCPGSLLDPADRIIAAIERRSGADYRCSITFLDQRARTSAGSLSHRSPPKEWSSATPPRESPYFGCSEALPEIPGAAL